MLGLSRVSRFTRLIGLAMVTGSLLLALQPQEADAAARNESRWFLQNVCLANAVKLMGDGSWTKFQKEARATRQRLASRGVPEAHLKEMESFATKIINSTTTPENVAEGPQLCIQWYKT